MKGRIFGIKKSTILKLTAILFVAGFFAYLFTCIFYLKSPILWFFGFCLFVGSFELFKSLLFKYDSCLYIGSLLIFIGTAGIVSIYTNTTQYAPYFVLLSFCLASIFTYVFTGQRYHLVIAFSIYFVCIYFLLWAKNFISTAVLIAFVVPFLVLLISEVTFWLILKLKKPKSNDK